MNWNEPQQPTYPYLNLLAKSGSRSSEKLKRSHPSGQATSSGSTKAAHTGGVTRFGGSGHTFSSASFSSSPPFSVVSSPSPNLIRLVLMVEAGRSAEEGSDCFETMSFIVMRSSNGRKREIQLANPQLSDATSLSLTEDGNKLERNEVIRLLQPHVP